MDEVPFVAGDDVGAFRLLCGCGGDGVLAAGGAEHGLQMVAHVVERLQDLVRPEGAQTPFLQDRLPFLRQYAPL